MAHVQARRRIETSERIARCFAVRAASYISSKQGAQVGWSYEDAEKFESALRNVLLALVGDGSKSKTLEHFQNCARDLYQRGFAPFRRCDEVCTQRDPSVCLYRFSAADLLNASAVDQKITPL